MVTKAQLFGDVQASVTKFSAQSTFCEDGEKDKQTGTSGLPLT
jgi:hypothetical protein